jgi:hypothetical protein
MHARPDVAQVLIKKKMRHWLSIARNCPHRNPGAKRNFIRLVERHPIMALEIGLSVLDAYK